MRRRLPIVAVLIFLLVAGWLLWGREYLNSDKCLDSGGIWISADHACRH